MKFFVKDEDNETFEVEEIEETPAKEVTTEVETKDEALSAEEIAALKKLAGVADKLIGMCTTSDEDESDEDDEDVDVDADVDVDEDEDGKEEVLDTDEDDDKVVKPRDSKKSFGSIEKKRKAVSTVDSQQESIAEAWAKRYGGNK